MRLSMGVIEELEREASERLPAHPTDTEQSLTDRVRRSLSWLRRAVAASPEDTPTRFLELWISLNALYSRRPYLRGVRIDESADFRHYMTRLEELDSSEQQISPLMRRSERKALSLVANKYLWNEFWRGENADLKREVASAQDQLRESLSQEDPIKFFIAIFERLKILRNQIAHGSSSVDTTKSQDSVKPGLLLIEDIIPVFLRLMIRQGLGKDWEKIPYPGRETPQHPK